MKIMVVGSDKIFAIENFFVKYLKERKVDLFHFPAQSIFYDYYQSGLINKLIFKTGFSSVLKKINNQFRSAVISFKPDVIWVFKGMEIFPESLQWAKDKNIKLVNYNPDNPFVFSGRGSGNTHLKKSIGLYNLHLTYNTDVKEKMEALFKIPTAILPFGFDISDELVARCKVQTEIQKACFLGNPDVARGIFLMKLAEKGIELDVYGNSWNKFVNHSNITIFTPVYGDDFWLTLRKYRVQLNLDRPHTFATHNMRSFEVPGVGGIQLAPKTNDHATYFEPGKEIFLYEDVYGCAVQIKKILALTEFAANVIRDNARKRSVESGYSYKHRTDQALAFIKSLYE
jgi:spore maturation protein CgeB